MPEEANCACTGGAVNAPATAAEWNAFFDRPCDRRGTASVKWDLISREAGKELLPLWVADMDFPCAPQVRAALVRRAEHGIYGYTYQTDAARQAMVDYMARRHGVRISAEQTALMPCVVTGLRAAVAAFTGPGDKVLIQPPVYGPFYSSVREAGRELAEAPLLCDAQGRWRMDLQAVEARCREGAQLMLLCNPHNPVGRLWTADELSALLQVLNRYQVTLISDEIHGDFAYEHPYAATETLPEAAQARLITMTSASKTFNLAGLQQAVFYTHTPELKERLCKTMEQSGVEQGNIFALAGTEAAYRYGDAWLDGLLTYLRGNRQTLADGVRALLPQAILSPMEATYLGWIDLRAYGLSGKELEQRTHDAGAAFSGGAFFGEKWDRFLRFNIATQRANVERGVELLAKALG